MEALVDLLLVSLSVSVQLGVPVVVLFVAAYLSHRQGRQQLDPLGPGPGDGGRRVARTPQLPLTDNGQATWQSKCCPPAAPTPVSLPCWQAVKTAQGRLRSQCLNCALFLTPTLRGQ